MGNTIEQYRSAIGRFKCFGCQGVSVKTRRETCLSEIMALLSVAEIRREAKQVDTKFFLLKSEIIKKLLFIQLQVWQGLFLSFAIFALWLFTANALLEVISVAASSQEAIKQRNCLPFSHNPTNVVRTSDSSTQNTFSPAKLDLIISDIIQMLLVIAGIETNPGPAIEIDEAGIVEAKMG